MTDMNGRHLHGIAAALALSSVAFGAVQASTPHPSLLLISVDGLRPDAVLEAERHGLKLPNLKAFMVQGAYATGVEGVLPTVTYPSHMTLLTGASPAAHGIEANTTFDPLARNDRGWYWYAEDDKVDTLWNAAHAAHLKTANVYWPTSVGADITYNLPQIWRRGTDDDLKLQRALSTPGLERELSASLGRYPGGEEETIEEDEVRARFAEQLIERKHPDFTTVYLSGLDTEEHASGPFSPQSNAGLERLDAVIGELRAAAERAAPGRATVCVVSDHGFAAVEHDVNLYAAFLDAGLFRLGPENKILDWKATLWPTGGTVAVMLADPTDAATRAKVSELLERLAADPANGIERILSRPEIAQRRGFHNAEFVVAFKIGYEIGDRMSLPLISAPTDLGMHGYLSERLEMRSAFFIVGPGIGARQSVGDIDMREIAPTLAKIMHVALKDAEMRPLPLR